MITGRQKTKQPHGEWDEFEILVFFSANALSSSFYLKVFSYHLAIHHQTIQLHNFKRAHWHISDWSHCKFGAWSPPPTPHFLKSQWRNIYMKVCLVGNKELYSYYTKQNYFNLRVNTILHQHDPISPAPIWWSNNTDPVSKHEPDNQGRQKKKHAWRASDSTAAIFTCIQMENKHRLGNTFSPGHWKLLCHWCLNDMTGKDAKWQCVLVNNGNWIFIFKSPSADISFGNKH